MTAQHAEAFPQPVRQRKKMRIGVTRSSASLVVGPWAHAVTNSRTAVASVPEHASIEEVSRVIAGIALDQPWLRALPPQQVANFVIEYISAVRDAVQSGDVSPIQAVVTAWRKTAAVYADPELYRELTRPLSGPGYGSPTF